MGRGLPAVDEPEGRSRGPALGRGSGGRPFRPAAGATLLDARGGVLRPAICWNNRALGRRVRGDRDRRSALERGSPAPWRCRAHRAEGDVGGRARARGVSQRVARVLLPARNICVPAGGDYVARCPMPRGPCGWTWRTAAGAREMPRHRSSTSDTSRLVERQRRAPHSLFASPRTAPALGPCRAKSVSSRARGGGAKRAVRPEIGRWRGPRPSSYSDTSGVPSCHEPRISHRTPEPARCTRSFHCFPTPAHNVSF